MHTARSLERSRRFALCRRGEGPRRARSGAQVLPCNASHVACAPALVAIAVGAPAFSPQFTRWNHPRDAERPLRWRSFDQGARDTMRRWLLTFPALAGVLGACAQEEAPPEPTTTAQVAEAETIFTPSPTPASSPVQGTEENK